MNALLTTRELLDDLLAEQLPRMVDAFCASTGLRSEELQITLDPTSLCWVVSAAGVRASGASLDSVLRRVAVAVLANVAAA